MRYVLQPLRIAYFWLALSATAVICVSIQAVFHAVGFLFPKRLPNGWEHLCGRWWAQLFFAVNPGLSIEILGREYLPKKGETYVVVSNHESLMDILAFLSVPFQFRWLSKASLFNIPLIGRAMRWAGYVAVDRGNRHSHQEAMHLSAERVREGVSMFFFPEGTRSDNGEVKPFKVGAFRLADTCKVPILPAIIVGARQILPKGAWVPKKAHVTIRFLPPMPKQSDETAESWAHRVRSEIVAARNAGLSHQKNPTAVQPKADS